MEKGTTNWVCVEDSNYRDVYWRPGDIIVCEEGEKPPLPCFIRATAISGNFAKLVTGEEIGINRKKLDQHVEGDRTKSFFPHQQKKAAPQLTGLFD